MRGESLEPGGCSVTPTSAWAAWSARRPADDPACAVAPGGSAAAVASGAAVCWASVVANDDEPPGATGGGGAAGCRAPCSASMRAMTASTLIPPGRSADAGAT